jgi:hypothetical protein
MSKIQGVNASNSVCYTASVKKSSQEESTADVFASMVKNLKEFKPAGDKSGSSEQDGTTTIKRLMSDGSLLITVMQGQEIISQSKTPATIKQKDPTLLETIVSKNGTQDKNKDGAAKAQNGQLAAMNDMDQGRAAALQQTIDHFNDTSTSIAAGALLDTDT